MATAFDAGLSRAMAWQFPLNAFEARRSSPITLAGRLILLQDASLLGGEAIGMPTKQFVVILAAMALHAADGTMATAFLVQTDAPAGA